MLSIVICSKTGSISNKLHENISETIGCVYEIIVLEGGYSIFNAYNLGILRSTYQYICFCHEDILFISNNWGIHLLSALNLPNCGLVGLAGTRFKSEIYSPWWLPRSSFSTLLETNYVIHPGEKQTNNYNQNSILQEVLIIDGVFIGACKKIFEEVKFDENLFSGFHFYDLDISLSTYFLGKKNYVIDNIHIIHDSKGKLNLEWVQNAELFHKKWNKNLPICIDNTIVGISNDIKADLIKSWILLYAYHKKFSFDLILWWFKFILVNPRLKDFIITSWIIFKKIIYRMR